MNDGYYDRLSLTIAAPATSPGSSVGIIRISGGNAFSIAENLTKYHSFKHRHAELCTIYESSDPVDTVIVLPFNSPASYTGEDVIELHVHGAAGQAAKVLSAVLSLDAIPALNGEFTFRAVMHGKMSLQKAATIPLLTTDPSEMTLSLLRSEYFSDHFTTSLKNIISSWESHEAHATAVVDFPEHVSEHLPEESIRNDAHNLAQLLDSIRDNSARFLRVHNPSVVLAGRTNAGKSTLFNALLRQERSIISETAGTTRDYISSSLSVGHTSVTLIDTAGIRQTGSAVEEEGVRRSHEQIDAANIVILVVNPFEESFSEDIRFFDTAEKSTSIIPVMTRYDICKAPPELPFRCIPVSGITNHGIDELLSRITKNISDLAPDPGQPMVFNATMHQTVNDIRDLIPQLTNALSSNAIEITSFIISDIVRLLRILTGETSDTEIFSRIFNEFCIGK